MGDFIYRAFCWDDLPVLVEMLNRAAEVDHEESRYTVEMLRHQFEMPDFSPENNVLVVTTPEGQMVGSGLIRLMFGMGRGWGSCVVAPEYRQQGIGTRLIRLGDARILELCDGAVEANTPIHVRRAFMEPNPGCEALFESEGYRLIRYFYKMRISLDVPLEPPAFPEGITLRPFDRERDSMAVYEAEMDAFSEHWGFLRMPYESWEHTLMVPDRFDPTLWLIAWDGDEVAGMSLNRRWGDDQPELAWVDVLCVGRPWRKRGLGAALLNQSFYLFQQRGYTLAGLNVDADNTTNAVSLYERVGMHVHSRQAFYRKVLRGREEDIQD